MTYEEAQQWLDALRQYEYRADLTAFVRRDQFGGDWFAQNLVPGNREQTMAFEDRFRRNAPDHSEAWFEVVFWKLFSMPPRRNQLTSSIIETSHRGTPQDFWNACTAFTREGSLGTFAVLQQFFVAKNALPVVATFVAFASPERFPMIDVQVVRAVRSYCLAHPEAAHNGLFARQHDRPLTTRDWDFYCAWIKWCRSSALILEDRTGTHWRARDVEMAAFQNERSHMPALPLIA
ncbi:MAG: hypothetical protein ABSB13_09895 [Candidatus Binatus sp.]|jgi:hypothetical protein|uniref:hypothetical protein n=1 Tax=Candidatus Binatus sp. TaxID=2811406 RepID=UPI003D0DE7B2